MERQLKFYNDPQEGWFVDLPEWPGDKADLAMVSGADTMLDIVSQGDSEILVTISDEMIKDADVIKWMYDHEVNGAYYVLEVYKGKVYHLDMWLCDVTKFVFGGFPKIIWIHEINWSPKIY